MVKNRRKRLLDTEQKQGEVGEDERNVIVEYVALTAIYIGRWIDRQLQTILFLC